VHGLAAVRLAEERSSRGRGRGWPEDGDILGIDGTAQWWLISPCACRKTCSRSEYGLPMSKFGEAIVRQANEREQLACSSGLM